MREITKIEKPEEMKEYRKERMKGDYALAIYGCVIQGTL